MLRPYQENIVESYDPYRFDTPDSYALKTGDHSTGGLVDPCETALSQRSGAEHSYEASPLSLAEKAFVLVGGIAFLAIALLSW